MLYHIIYDLYHDPYNSEPRGHREGSQIIICVLPLQIKISPNELKPSNWLLSCLWNSQGGWYVGTLISSGTLIFMRLCLNRPRKDFACKNFHFYKERSYLLLPTLLTKGQLGTMCTKGSWWLSYWKWSTRTSEPRTNYLVRFSMKQNNMQQIYILSCLMIRIWSTA